YGFLIPVFFIWVGINFRFDLLLNRSGLFVIPPLLVAAFLVKIVPFIIVNYRTLPLKDSFAAGFLSTANL
ncbi:cation:proton antiporter, partial [bacterium]|nr:cation:proton antiporter [bacterium]NIO74191.1 cation:proton antiporter [bacterium]